METLTEQSILFSPFSIIRLFAYMRKKFSWHLHVYTGYSVSSNGIIIHNQRIRLFFLSQPYQMPNPIRQIYAFRVRYAWKCDPQGILYWWVRFDEIITYGAVWIAAIIEISVKSIVNSKFL